MFKDVEDLDLDWSWLTEAGATPVTVEGVAESVFERIYNDLKTTDIEVNDSMEPAIALSVCSFNAIYPRILLRDLNWEQSVADFDEAEQPGVCDALIASLQSVIARVEAVRPASTQT